MAVELVNDNEFAFALEQCINELRPPIYIFELRFL